MLDELRRALDNGSTQLSYQLRVSLKIGGLGTPALAHGYQPEQGFVSHSVLIPLAEQINWPVKRLLVLSVHAEGTMRSFHMVRMINTKNVWEKAFYKINETEQKYRLRT